MTRQFLLTFIFGLSFFITAYAQDSLKTDIPTFISINEAINKGILELKISGAYDPRIFYEVVDKDGVHYGKCMAIILKSKIDTFVLVKIDCGTLLVPTDDSVQTMIVTQDAELPLYPNLTYATRFYAMCTEFHDEAPTIGTTFRIGDMADSSLVKLSKYLESTYMQNMVGQHAVWAFTDQVSFADLVKYGGDSLSIATSIEILNAVKIETPLNKFAEKKVEIVSTIAINRYIVYGGLVMILILTITVVTLLSRLKKKENIV